MTASSQHIQKWDAWNRSDGPNYPHNKLVQFCLRRYPPSARAAMRVLDLGCGTGVNTWFLAREGFSVAASDVSSYAIDATRARLNRDGLSARLAVESADAIGAPDASFDLVVCIGVLEAAGPEVAPAIFTEVRRVLAPGGAAFFLCAAAGDYRLGDATPYSLYGFSEHEVRSLSAVFDEAVLDRYMTTYSGGESTQFDWLVTCEVK